MPRKHFLAFSTARRLARAAALESITAYKRFIASPAGQALRIPANPQLVYRDQFRSWEDYLGTPRRISRPHPHRIRSFFRARILARTLAFTSPRQWQAFVRSRACPPDIPADPRRAYAGLGWKGYPDFLGYEPITGTQRTFWSYGRAQRYVQTQRVRSSLGYQELFASDPHVTGLPSHPDRTYTHAGWCGWPEFLGKGYAPLPAGLKSTMHGFAKARGIARKLGLSSSRDYAKYVRGRARDPRMPARPAAKYKETGWRGWKDFLGHDGPYRRGDR